MIVTRPAINGNKDYLMIIARVGFTINLSFCLPLNLSPERLQICSFLKIKQPSKAYIHFTITFILLAGSAFVGYIFPQIVDVISLLGGLCSVAIVITFPGMMYYKLSGLKMSDCKLLTVVIFTLLLTLAGWAAGVISFLNLIG